MKTALENIENGKPVFTGGRNLTAKNFVTSMQALGLQNGHSTGLMTTERQFLADVEQGKAKLVDIK